MTAATYSWPRGNLVANGSFETTVGTTTDFQTWVEEGSPVRGADISGDGGSYSAELADNAGVYQTGEFVTTNKGRYFDQLDPLLLTFYGAYGTTGSATAWLRVQLFILDGSDTIKYSYDFAAGKWKAPTTTAIMNDGESLWYAFDSSETSGVQKVAPRIEAPASAGSDVVDTYKLRLRFINQTADTASVRVDNVELSTWTANTKLARVGRFYVAYNGVNYPVKYDSRTGLVTELSLNYPYQHGDFPIPIGTGGSGGGGSLESSKFFGVAYTFVDLDTEEESAAPRGAGLSSGYFTVDTGASDTHVDVDFSGVVLPNTDATRSTDNARIQRIRVYRTTGRGTQVLAADAARNEAGALIYEGDVEVGGTFRMSLSDTDLLKQGETTMPFIASRMPTNMFSVGYAHRNRLWSAGGRTFRMGEVTVYNAGTVTTPDTAYIDGTEVTAAFTNAATQWHRGVEWGVFQVDGDNKTYDVERYAYPGDSGTTTLPERLYLTQEYRGAASGNKEYTIRPKNGRVWFSEEGRPYESSGQSFFQLDGDEGEPVTGLVSAQTAILAMTRRSTFVYDYELTPLENNLARPISRTLGCIAADSPVEIRGVAYWLSAEGVVRSDGTRVEVISNDLQDIFTDPDDTDYIVRESWSQLASACQGAHFPQAQQYLLAVKTKNAKHGCDLVLAYNYFFESWDILRLTTGLMRWSEAEDSEGNSILGFTDDAGQWCRWDAGHVDGVGEVNNHGALRGEVSSATALSLTPTEAGALYSSSLSNNFTSATLGLEGAWLKIVEGTGVGQKRRVEKVVSGVIYFTDKWETTPDSTSVWELGGIDFEWNFKRSNFGTPGRPKTVKFLNVDQKPQDLGGSAEVRYFSDSNTSHHLVGTTSSVARFSTGAENRVKADGNEATGYALRVQIKLDGPEKPIEVWNLSAPVVYKQEDR